jgi:putative lipoprotein
MRRAGLGAALLALTACASAPGPARLTGTVAYRERVALAPGARVEVVLLDVSLVDAPAQVIAKTERVTSGEQVPIPFALDYDRGALERGHRYGLHAKITGADGRVAWATAASQPVLGAGDPAEPSLLLAPVATHAVPGGPRVLAYACEGFAFRVEVTPERATLFLPGRTVTLPAQPAASGAKYSDGTTTYWSKGDKALLDDAGVPRRSCRMQPLQRP